MKRSLGSILLAAGALICVLGAVGLTLGMFVTIPEAVARVVVRAVGFSAPFLVGGAFMLAGAAVQRANRAAANASTTPAAPPAALPDPASAAGAAPGVRRDAVPAPRAGSRST
jgi:hypothetical protein